MLDLHPETLRRYVAEGRIPAVRVGGKRSWLKFRVDDLQAIAAGAVDPAQRDAAAG